jgi:hypothetical protein
MARQTTSGYGPDRENLYAYAASCPIHDNPEDAWGSSRC